MMPCITLLLGLDATELDWDERCLTTSSLTPAFRRYLDGHRSFRESPSTPRALSTQSTTASQKWPSWRVIDSWTHVVGNDVLEHDGAGDRAMNEVTLLCDVPSSERDDFAEHSFAVFETARDPDGIKDRHVNGNGHDETSFLTATSSHIDTSFNETQYEQETLPQNTYQILFPRDISTLKSLPSAANLPRAPSTMTVNLIVGLVSKSQPRQQTLRRHQNKTMTLVDLTVGDDTKAPFQITFWLQSVPSTEEDGRSMRSKHKARSRFVDQDQGVRKALEGLRNRDILLLRNVALASWKGLVFGQSLSRRIARTETQIFILGRDGVTSLQGHGQRNGSEELMVANDMQSRVAKVGRWVRTFLPVQNSEFAARRVETIERIVANGRGRKGTKRRRRSGVGFEDESTMLPPETPEH